jgi:hypothetical protein
VSIHRAALETMVEKLLGDAAVALDRCGCESLLILKMLSELSC